MQFNKLDLAKQAVGLIVGAGVTKVVKNVIRTHVSPETLWDRVTILSAEVTLTMMVTTATRKFTDGKIDEVVAWYIKTVDEAKAKNKSA